jgi:peptidyl-prolyl cis-trans isomerase D
MAIIGKIRNRAGLIIGTIGFSMVAFIAGDLITNNRSFIFGNKNEIGLIAGESVTPQEFNAKFEEQIFDYKLNQNKENVETAVSDQIKEQTWNDMVKDIIYGKEYNELGIVVSDEEVYDMITGKNPHPQIRQAFTDPKTGQFDPQNVVNFLKNLDTQSDTMRTRWNIFESQVKKERYETKLKDLAKFGIYETTADAKRTFTNGNKFVNIKYVVSDFRNISDSTIKVSEDDIKKYYDEHKYEYKQADNSRKLEYIQFDVNPSDEDRKVVQDWANKMKEEFATTKLADSLFVNRNSDTKYNDDATMFKKGALSPELDTVMFHEKEGFIYGPYEEGGFFKIAKLAKVVNFPDSVKARHILVKIKQGENPDSVVMRMDSIRKQIRAKKVKFEDLAKQMSEDPGSGAKGGDLGWFKEGAMVKPFNDSCFYGKKGDMKIVTSQFGVHLIEIMDQSKTTKRVKVIFVDRKVEPTTKTFNAVLSKANDFISKTPSGDQFASSAKNLGLPVRPADNIKETDKTLPGMENSRELIVWAFKAKKGEMSKVYAVGQKYVIGHLLDIKEKGFASLDNIRPRIELLVKKDKKASMLMDKMKGSVDEVASKNNLTVDTTSKVSFQSGGIPGHGMEYDVVGTIFSMKTGETKTIKGSNGVYVITLQGFINPDAPANFNGMKGQMMQQVQQKAENGFFEALKELANIVDNRGKYF